MHFKNFIYNEIYGSFNYVVPKNDHKTLIYDFYMFSYLYKRIKYEFIPNPDKNNGILNLGSTFTTDSSKDRDDQLDYMLEEVGSKLIPFLKKHLLDCVFYACCCELRHLKYEFAIFANSSDFNYNNILYSKDYEVFNPYLGKHTVNFNINQNLKEKVVLEHLSSFEMFLKNNGFLKDEIDIIINYIKLYLDYNSVNINFKDKFNKIKSLFHNNELDLLKHFNPILNKDFIEQIKDVNDFDNLGQYTINKIKHSFIVHQKEIDRINSYSYFKKLNIPELYKIFIFKKLFSVKAWTYQYGGKSWAEICQGYIDLYNAKTINQQLIQIDHVYDLQHNTGSVLNKAEIYNCYNGFDIDSILDKKKFLKSPYEIIDEISPSFKSLALRLIKSKFGTSYEQYLKTYKNGKDIFPQF